MKKDKGKIINLNDKFRKTFVGGKIIITKGIYNLFQNDVEKIISKVKSYNNFNLDNDPYGEHDFGSFLYKDNKIFWKIDYYDTNYLFYSINPSDEECTNRVLTIMKSDEY